MSSNSSPLKGLSYLSLKCVLEYMNPGQRILYMSQIFQSAHNATPLCIKLLKFKENTFTIDNLKFKFHPIANLNNEIKESKLLERDWDDSEVEKGDIWIPPAEPPLSEPLPT